jgi:hypothetical protein
MALLVTEAGKKGRYKQGAERKDHLSLSLMCLLSFSTLFVCPCVRHRSWKKKKRDREKEQKIRSFPIGKIVNKTPGTSPSYLLTYLLTYTKPKPHNKKKKKTRTSSSSNFKIQRKYTREKAKQNRYLAKERDVYICIRQIAVDPNSPRRKYPLQLSPPSVSLFLAPSSLVCLLRRALPPPQFCFSLSLSRSLCGSSLVASSVPNFLFLKLNKFIVLI